MAQQERGHEKEHCIRRPRPHVVANEVSARARKWLVQKRRCQRSFESSGCQTQKPRYARAGESLKVRLVMTESKETYLGDGLYASFDGYQIIFRAPRENGDHHWVALEPPVYAALVEYVAQLKADAWCFDYQG
jgi:hypothetical protein